VDGRVDLIYIQRSPNTMILDPIRLIIGGAFLFYAAVLDIKTRRVPNIVWIYMGAIGIVFLHCWISLENTELISFQ